MDNMSPSMSSSSDMSSMSSMSMSMSQMRMTFFTSSTTPLYSTAWTPSSLAQYAGTCIFLILFAVVFRALLAVRAGLERRWRALERERKGRLVIRRPDGIMGSGDGLRRRMRRRESESESLSVSVVSDRSSDVPAAGVLPPTVKGDDEDRRRGGGGDDDEKEETSKMVQTSTPPELAATSSIPPWRISQDGVRACVDVAIAGVGYLLMLAVMTMNVGYFLSILAGTFLGSLVLGRYAIFVLH